MKRRTFLKAGASALAWSALGHLAYAAPAVKPRRVALIGAGWYGKVDLLRLIQVEPVEVVGLCDVDSRMLAEAAQIVATRQVSKKTPPTYKDYRELLAQQKPDIAIIGTPDHWHALPAIAAIQSGADVYVQKPISVDVVEGQAILAAARRHNRVVQVGTQRRSTPHLIEARDRILRAGLLGDVGFVETYCLFRRGPQNPPDSDPPDYLDFDLWTGPAPLLPYNRMMHPRGWRSFMEFGNGHVGDIGIHLLDSVRWMLDLGWPRSVSASGGIYVNAKGKSNTPDTQFAIFDFGHMTVTWQQRAYGAAADPKFSWGWTIHGNKGVLRCSIDAYEFTPYKGEPVRVEAAAEFDKYPEDETEKDLEHHVAPAVRAHMRDFLAAIDARSKPVADIEQGFISTTCCILANHSTTLGRSVHYDPATGKTSDPEANKLLARPYRAPWQHPDPALV